VGLGWLDPVATVGAGIGLLYGLDRPDLSNPALIRRGAAHYDLVCAGCHGSPDKPDRGRHLHLSPPAPTLHLRLAGWPPEQLFRVVRDGIPGSGMPAWPAPDREDEVWAVVAFLAALPDMGERPYLALAGRTATADPLITRCVACHGSDGRGDGAFPHLDLQTPRYLADALTAFRDGRRASGFMQSATAGLTDADIGRLARHYGRTTRPPQPAGPPPQLVTQGDRHRRIAACAACHGPPGPVRDAIPRLAGQDAAYLQQQMQLFARREGAPRGGGPMVALMQHAVGDISPEEIARLARWYAGSPR
jgi:cytochrome c553